MMRCFGLLDAFSYLKMSDFIEIPYQESQRHGFCRVKVTALDRHLGYLRTMHRKPENNTLVTATFAYPSFSCSLQPKGGLQSYLIFIKCR